MRNPGRRAEPSRASALTYPDMPNPRSVPRRPSGTIVAGVLAAAMAVSVFPSLVLGILAGSLIDDLGIGRTEIGIAVAAALPMLGVDG